MVFDDPFSSQDKFRRTNTLFEMKKCGDGCAQVFVLSHDAKFLKAFWDMCDPSQRAALQLEDRRGAGSHIIECCLDEVCQGRVEKELNDLIGFHSTGTGKLHQVVKSMRVVLETHLSTTYSGAFTVTELGKMLGEIRAQGESHPAHHLYEQSNRINSYSCQYHHGERATNDAGEPIDPTELDGFVKQTLVLTNNLQA